MSGLLVVGTVAYDSLKTPYGVREKVLGGSAMHAAIAASLRGPVKLMSIVGDDFEKKYLELFISRQIDISGIHVVPGGKTFFWKGFYEQDMNQAHSLQTDLNVLLQFKTEVPVSYRSAKYVLLGNIDPDLQYNILEQLKPTLIAADTMNFWIQSKPDSVKKVLSACDLVFINDAEIRQLTGVVNLVAAARSLLTTKLHTIIVKKGEHGALIVRKDFLAAVPAFPLEVVKDPTGAGDSFAGGCLSYLAKAGVLDDQTLHQAVVYGTLMASFNVEEFSCERTVSVTQEDVAQRFKHYKEIVNIPNI